MLKKTDIPQNEEVATSVTMSLLPLKMLSKLKE